MPIFSDFIAVIYNFPAFYVKALFFKTAKKFLLVNSIVSVKIAGWGNRLRHVAIGREPVHQLFAVLDDGPLLSVGSARGGEKRRMQNLKFLQGFDRGLRKPDGNMLVVILHKNREGGRGLIAFQFYVSRSHRALMIAQTDPKVKPSSLF